MKLERKTHKDRTTNGSMWEVKYLWEGLKILSPINS